MTPNFNQSVFNTSVTQNNISIPEKSEIIFVSDMFISDYPFGGAEKTSEALIETSPFSVFKLHSKMVTMELLEQGVNKYWIFGNFSALDQKLIPSIVANLDYSVIEYDYKFCKYRSPEKHKSIEQVDCNCSNDISGKMVSAFYHGAKSLFWMSEKQEEIYCNNFPFLNEKENMVLSSVFDEKFFAMVKHFRDEYKDKKEDHYLVQEHSSWIKGTQEAKDYCEKNNLPYKTFGGIPYEEMIEEFAKAKGFVYLPPGGDTCPRTVIEAKLLNCELVLNENVQHKDEIWFNTEDLFDTEAYLYMSRQRFWQKIKNDMEFQPTISGYTTTRNCITQNYPFEQCIESMLGFCDEVVVVDSSDANEGTWQRLQDLSEAHESLSVRRIERDYTKPRSSIFDGLNKALARSLCTKDYCIQLDADEIIHEEDYDKYKVLVKNFPKNILGVSLPVIEPWGKTGNIRMDINPAKWRLSKNMPEITHGIPAHAREFDEDGRLYCKPYMSDGCDMIKFDDYQALAFATFMTNDVENMRRQAIGGNEDARKQFEDFFNKAITEVPSVFHYGWWDIETKIEKYFGNKDGFYGWMEHWNDLYNLDLTDTPENNMFFDKKRSEVSDEEKKELAAKLEHETGGHVFHQKWDPNKKVPSMSINREHPKVIQDWLKS